MPVDAELSHLGFEGLSGETKLCRSTGRAADDTVRLAQRGLDDRLLTLSQICGQCAVWHSGLGRSRGQPAGIHPKDIPVAQDHCPLDHILELTNVAGPVVGFEQIERVLADTSNPLAGLLSISFDQILHEQRNVTTPIPSRKIVPPSADSNRPRRLWSAPVNAPFSCPNSSEASNEGGIAAQLTRMNARLPRLERLWIARATSSLPVPVSPWIRTVESVGATFAICANTVRSASEEPTISSNIDERTISSRNATFSFRVRSSARLRSSMSVPVAYQLTRRPCSSWKGL